MQHIIAIVDDEPSVLRALKRVVEAHGYSAHVYGSGREFLDDCSDDIDCVVLDINMNAMSGIETKRCLSSTRPALPVIFMTGQDSPEVRQHVAQVGCTCYLRKPFAGKVLIKAIEQALGDDSPGGGPSRH
jgi:FixJ family two-component response regulator